MILECILEKSVMHFWTEILVAEDTDKGRAVGRTVMNCRFSQTARNVLTS
jgi:hypothetical protein